jgi:hypothetical protein
VLCSVVGSQDQCQDLVERIYRWASIERSNENVGDQLVGAIVDARRGHTGEHLKGGLTEGIVIIADTAM